MAKEIIFDGGKVINSTDWEGKSKDIIAKLDAELFANIKEDDLYESHYSKEGDLLHKKKRKLGRGEIVPIISPAQVTVKLNRHLRVYRPMTTDEARSLEDIEYLDAYGYYLDIIAHINKYVTFLGDKQSFSAFCNITSDIYNEFLTDQHYSRVFASIEDSFVQSNFAVAEAGLVDGRTTIAKLQTKNAGHSLKRTDETVVYNVTNKINTSGIDAMYEKFVGVSQKPKQIGKGERK